jgi:hypothetical protein
MMNGHDGKRDGMSRAEQHSDPHWWQCMLECGKEVAERKPYFITDDVVLLCRQRHPNASTHEQRALGPLMSQMCRLGYCERTQDWVESMQPQCHRRPMRVWFSLIYQGPPVAKPRSRKLLDPRQFTMDL